MRARGRGHTSHSMPAPLLPCMLLLLPLLPVFTEDTNRASKTGAAPAPRSSRHFVQGFGKGVGILRLQEKQAALLLLKGQRTVALPVRLFEAVGGLCIAHKGAAYA